MLPTPPDRRAASALAGVTALAVAAGGCATSVTAATTQATGPDVRAGRTAAVSAPPIPAAPVSPTLTPPPPLPTVVAPPAPLPEWPTRAQVATWSCDRVVRAVNGAAARCLAAGDPALQAQSVDGESTVGLTDDDQVVYVQRGMSSLDTYLVAMHERGHQELRQRCSTWACGDILVRRMGTTRSGWNQGPYFDRVVEAAASTWARCHGADNARYGYQLSCQDLERAFAAETTARAAYVRDKTVFDTAWADYHRAYERYRDAVTRAASSLP
ncbi:hypothetical protein [Arsenicicoccus dermatophilus]|uniref:hypothetical protein n=1 Tax=Arsenicicoccus dermatophilus TaxID=1076331 RepID=UPI0039170520